MADLSGLKQRVEQVDLRLKTAHRAREKESAALMELWDQIRERFAEQSDEIAALQQKVAELEDTRDDLLQMVHGLLAAVEGGLERMSDETVPQIKAMAGNLLNGAAVPLSVAQPVADDAVETLPEYPESNTDAPELELQDDMEEERNFHDDLLSAIEKSIGSAEDANIAAAVTPTEEIEEKRIRPAGKPVSPGIRDLVSRIEDAMGQDFTDSPDAEFDDDDELTRDLREIEALRGELDGLRQRISGSM